MKLLERTHGKHAPERAPEMSDHEVMERLEVPEDLSGLVEAPSIEERAVETHRAASMVRWLRWAPVVLLAVAGIVTALVIWNGGGGETEVAPWPFESQFDSPGGNSLNAPVPVVVGLGEMPFESQFDSPGGNSLNAPVPVVVGLGEMPFESQFDSPGGNSLNAPVPAES